MICSRPKNWRRKLINENNLLQYIEKIPARFSEKNRQIVRDYASGMTYKELSSKYGVSSGRIEEVLQTFFYYLNKLQIYSFTKDPLYFEIMLNEILKDDNKRTSDPAHTGRAKDS